MNSASAVAAVRFFFEPAIVGTMLQAPGGYVKRGATSASSSKAASSSSGIA
jgi:hypothetical protein